MFGFLFVFFLLKRTWTSSTLPHHMYHKQTSQCAVQEEETAPASVLKITPKNQRNTPVSRTNILQKQFQSKGGSVSCYILVCIGNSLVFIDKVEIKTYQHKKQLQTSVKLPLNSKHFKIQFLFTFSSLSDDSYSLL